MYILLAGLPVVVAIAGAGLWLMARGAALGPWLIGLAVLVGMLLAGQGLPRPDVVARPGEESEY